MDIETIELHRPFKPFSGRALVYQSGDTVFHAYQLLSAVRLTETLTLPLIIQGEVCAISDNIGMIPVNTFLPFDLERTFRLDSDPESDEEQLRKIMFEEGSDQGERKWLEIPSRQVLLSVRFGEDLNRDGWSWPNINLTSVMSAPLPDTLVQLLTELKLRIEANRMFFDSDCQVDPVTAKARFKYFYPSEIGRPVWRGFFREGDNLGIPIISDRKTPLSEYTYHHEIELPSLRMVIFRRGNDNTWN